MNFLKKIFVKLSTNAQEKSTDTESVLSNTLNTLIKKSGLSLSFHMKKKDDLYLIEIQGQDQSLLLAKEGRLLNALQMYLKRVLQHNGIKSSESRFSLDCSGFRKKVDRSLIDLAKKLKGMAVNRGEPVYFKALPPRDRKVIHQYISEDHRVKSSSLGDGLYKKIKIYPVRSERRKPPPGKSL